MEGINYIDMQRELYASNGTVVLFEEGDHIETDTEDEIVRFLLIKSESYIGRQYGWLKLLIHLLDAFLTFLRRKETYFFRRMMFYDRYPICSWVEAYAYKAIQVDFGCEPNTADPDVIQDYKKTHPEIWKLIVKAERGVMIVNES